MPARRSKSEAISVSNSDESPRGLTIAEAAKFLGVKTYFLRTQIWRRTIPFCRFGHRYVFDIRDLERFLEQNKVPIGAR